MPINSTSIKSSRYVSGGVTEVNSTALEWWERGVIAPDSTDFYYAVEQNLEGRIDLIANKFLGEPRHWWIIAMLNNILDPYNEIRTGTLLLIPTAERAKNLLSGRTGGIISKREVPLTILPIL